MKVFVTGATGFVGSRVLPLLAKAGHEVTALVRKPADAEKLKARNVQPVLGDLHSLDVIAQAALAADAVLHLAFIHDFNNYAESCLVDGVENGVKVMVMRLPIYVYDNSFFCSFMLDVQTQAAQRSGATTYIGSGEQGVTYRQIATAIADKLGTDIRPIDGAPIQAVEGTSLPVRSITQEEAAQLYGSPLFAWLFSISNDLDATKTREELRWNPVHNSGFTTAIADVKPTKVPVGADPTQVGG
ncbi:hypothetical protein WJX74_003099 [Apatococcus lobatus]|uniref:NAD(P)-binding domain-containing protein n=1 Tax=Apatococcus lobatus TaxID=904363 RepID=A0AAW1Q8X2_9CHLO